MLDSIGLVTVVVMTAAIIGAVTTWTFRKDREAGFVISAVALLGTVALAAESGSKFGLWIRFVVVFVIACGATIAYLMTRQKN